MINLIKVPTFILLFAFRYSLNRNTSGCYGVVQELKRHWDSLEKEFRRQIKDDIKLQIRITKNETEFSRKISDDFIDLLKWIEDKER